MPLTRPPDSSCTLLRVSAPAGVIASGSPVRGSALIAASVQTPTAGVDDVSQGE